MLSRFFVWCWDLDLSWVGMGHLRPAKDQPLTLRTTLIVAHVWSLPLLALPVFLLAVMPHGGFSVAWVVLATAFAYTLNLCGNLISAMLWNERAAGLRAGPTPEPA